MLQTVLVSNNKGFFHLRLRNESLNLARVIYVRANLFVNFAIAALTSEKGGLRLRAYQLEDLVGGSHFVFLNGSIKHI
jgi:hypothetical protein